MYKTLKNCLNVYIIPTGECICLRENIKLKLIKIGIGFIVEFRSYKFYLTSKEAEDKLGISSGFCFKKSLLKVSQVIDRIKQIYDPELPINIYDLGLIYNIKINHNFLSITMTLTSPTCGMGPVIISELDYILSFKNIQQKDISITFSPPWDKSMMSEEARLILGI